MNKNVHIKYYASMREQRGIPQETVLTKASTVGDLYDELKQKHTLSLDKDILRVAVNQEYKPWDSSLQDNDEVMFIPPVNGG